MKIIAAVLIVLTLVIAIVPQFTDCLSQGRTLKLANGNTVPMKCHWSSMALLGLALPLGGTGALLAFTKRRESQRNLGLLAGVMGIVTALIPTVLIGVCADNHMLCNSLMLPTVLLSGILVAVAGFGSSIYNIRMARKPEFA